MAITGSVKIELFDAATGEKTDEVVSSNMVTNAVRNIVNPDRAIVDGGYVYGMDADWMEQWVGATSPIGKKLFKGIMLFNKKLTESVNNIIPDKSTREAMIGCAGGGSSLEGNNFRGTYNATESRELSNGYSHVWDFATNQANGVINAVALTSEWGGEMGWKATAYEMAKSLMPLTGESTWMNSVSTADIPHYGSNGYYFRLENYISVPSSSSEGGYYKPLCTVFVADGYLFEVVIRDDRKLMEVYRKNLTNPLSLVETLLTNPVSFSGATPTLRSGAKRFEFTSVDGFCAEDGYRVDICHVPNGVMFVSYSISKATSPEDTNKLIINTTTLALVDGELAVSTGVITSGLTKQIRTFRGYGSVSTAASDGEYLYVYSGEEGYLDKIYKIKIKGTKEESEITLPFKVGSRKVCLGTFLDTIFVCSDEPTILYLLNSTKTAFVSGLSAQVYNSSRGRVSYFLTQLTPPWILAVEDMKVDRFTRGVYPMVVSPYLATINNLQTAVAKTASKTMKITYTIQNV